jgi:hypothetical protein
MIDTAIACAHPKRSVASVATTVTCRPLRFSNPFMEDLWHSTRSSTSTTFTAFERTSKRRRGFPERDARRTRGSRGARRQRIDRTPRQE